MPLSDLDCANLCWSCYNDTETFDHVIYASDVWVGVKNYDDCSAIAFRGSTTCEDWLRDFQAVMVYDPALGGVELGFLSGIRTVSNEIQKLIPINDKTYITGHSLGAARALIYAAYDKISYDVPMEVVTFGSPRPGGEKIKGILRGVPIRSYRNMKDPVCDVPLNLPLIPYMHPRELITVSAPPPPDDPWGGLMGYHHIQRYQEAMKGLKNV